MRYRHQDQGSSGQDSASGCMVPPARRGPQRGARLLWIPSQVPASTQKPLGLLPRPWDYLGATVRGCSHAEKRRTDAASSLWKCNKQRIQLRTEFDATSEAMQVVADAPSSREMEHRLSSLQTSLTMIERAIMRYENIIEDCRMQEEEACQEEISHEQEEEDVINAEMVDEEGCGDPEPSDPQGEADTEGIPPLDPVGDAVSPEEDAFLMQPASQSEDPTAGSHSPGSETGTVSGEMADLSLTSPSQPGPGEDKTQQ